MLPVEQRRNAGQKLPYLKGAEFWVYLMHCKSVALCGVMNTIQLSSDLLTTPPMLLYATVWRLAQTKEMLKGKYASRLHRLHVTLEIFIYQMLQSFKKTQTFYSQESNKLLLIIYILFMSKRKEFVCVKYCVQSCVIVRLKLLTVKKPNDKKTFFYVGLTGFNRIIILNVCKLQFKNCKIFFKTASLIVSCISNDLIVTTLSEQCTYRCVVKIENFYYSPH